MILVCTACKSSYLVPANVFASGPRQVRCARCAHSWLADLPPKITAVIAEMSEAPAAASSGPMEPPPVTVKPIPKGSNLPAVQRPNWKNIRRKMEIAAGGILVMALVAGGVFYGKAIVPYLPEMPKWEKFSGFFSFGEIGKGLSLQDIRSERRYLEGGMQLVVEGKVLNETKEPMAVPDIQITALGPDGKIMQSWRIPSPAATLDPGASAPFQSSINPPQGTVVEVNLKFVEPRHEK